MTNKAGEQKIKILTRDSELEEALKHVLENTMENVKINTDEPDLILFDLCDSEPGGCNQDLLIKHFLGSDPPNDLPFILILGAEKELNAFDKIGKNEIGILEIQLFTELCTEYYEFLPIPFLLPELKKQIEGILSKGRELPNPFIKLRTLTEELGNLKNRGSNSEYVETLGKISQDFERALFLFKSIGKYANPDVRQEQRKIGYHDTPQTLKEKKVRFLIYDLAIATVRYAKADEKRLNVLLIENNPQREAPGWEPISFKELLKVIHTIFDKYSFWIYQSKEECRDLAKYLKAKIENPATPEKIPSASPLLGSSDPKTDFDYSLTLIDIFLGEEPDLDGVYFLELLTNAYPKIPAFIMSGSDDYEIMRRTLKSGADYYIHKSQTFSIPYCYYEYLDELGKLISLIKTVKMRNNLIGNIRYWTFKRDFLWFGDKCYHMVNHSFYHTMNDWKITNEFLYPLLQKEGLKSNANKNEWRTERNLYCLCMAIWLHDIGHKGSERCGEAAEIRDKHGILSGEWILTNPSMFRIYEEKEENKGKSLQGLVDLRVYSYELDKKPVTQLLQERIKGDPEKLSIPDITALLSIYHKSNAPLTRADYEDMVGRKVCAH